MVKYNTEFKMKLVKKYLGGKVSYNELVKNTASEIRKLLECGSMLTNLKGTMD